MNTYVATIEKAIGITMQPAPDHGYDPIRDVMACRARTGRQGGFQPLFALHSDGALAGLNLAGTGLTDEQWGQIAAALDLSRLEALNLRGNRLSRLPGLEHMVRLRYLDLCDNQFVEFSLPEGVEGLEHLWLGGGMPIWSALHPRLSGRVALPCGIILRRCPNKVRRLSMKPKCSFSAMQAQGKPPSPEKSKTPMHRYPERWKTAPEASR